jgi:Xaa-Pro aminopeptidase
MESRQGNSPLDDLRYSFPDGSAYQPPVAQNHAALNELLAARSLDVVVVTTQDQYITEYMPRQNNQRFALSAFSGSTGEGLFVRREVADRLGMRGQFVLFVDGRYHLHAEREVDPELVALEKLTLQQGMWESMSAWIVARAADVRNVGYDGRRLSVAQRRKLLAELDAAGVRLESFEDGEIDAAIRLPGWHVDRPIFSIPERVTGRSLADNLTRLRERMRARTGHAATCFLTCASDDVSYLLNSRGYHVPNASSNLGYLFVLPEHAALFLPEGCETVPVDLAGGDQVHVFRDDKPALLNFLARSDVRAVCYRGEAVNCALPDMVSRVWPDAQHDGDFTAVEEMRAAKTEAELDAIRLAFERSSRAIAEALRWAKYGEPGAAPTEYGLAAKINDAYRAQGAVALSFRSIAATGESAAIIHYTLASNERPLAEGDMIMLDSGAYYEEGFATDCTRAVLRKTKPDTAAAAWQREIYTITLKAAIAGLMTPFARTASGRDVDELVRDICKAHGYDYGHGTGHGVGIHVHEGGVRFGPASTYGLVENAVISVEPGIYVPGRGGVRIENVVIMKPDPAAPDRMRFDNIVSVGYDWDLIDVELLTAAEREYLLDYERHCEQRGTAIMPCPLLQAAV